MTTVNCRFDGAKPVFGRGNNDIRFIMICPICHARTEEHVMQSEAVNEWNVIQGIVGDLPGGDTAAGSGAD